ncbi:MAG: hypothetical protein MZV70_40205 [Desulfobacterales bacterium]|nr:hypothetical protein [Desulfobacterales bacterium]
MLDYRWPGNVRELQNAIQFAFVKCGGKVIEIGGSAAGTARGGRCVRPPGAGAQARAGSGAQGAGPHGRQQGQGGQAHGGGPRHPLPFLERPPGAGLSESAALHSSAAATPAAAWLCSRAPSHCSSGPGRRRPSARRHPSQSAGAARISPAPAASSELRRIR